MKKNTPRRSTRQINFDQQSSGQLHLSFYVERSMLGSMRARCCRSSKTQEEPDAMQASFEEPYRLSHRYPRMVLQLQGHLTARAGSVRPRIIDNGSDRLEHGGFAAFVQSLISQTLHVCYICLHWPPKPPQCRHIYGIHGAFGYNTTTVSISPPATQWRRTRCRVQWKWWQRPVWYSD